jgi:SNF2 family DNA or RNA helicase
MQTIRIITDTPSGQFIVRSPFEAKNLLKALPGRKWETKDKIPPRGAWVYPATGAAAANLKFVIGKSASFTLEADEPFHVLADAALESLAANKRPASSFDPIPETNEGLPPFPHQVKGYHLATSRDGVLLVWEMGTGKSRTVIDVVRNAKPARVLIVCPKTVIGAWQSQFSIHAPGLFNVAYLSKRTVAKRKKEAQAVIENATTNNPGVVVVNYESVWRAPLGKWVQEQDWDLVVCDESQRIKTHTSKVSKFFDKLRPKARRRLALTGTPMPKDPLDLFAQMRFIDPGVFGASFGAFKGEYAVLGGFEGKQVLGFKNKEKMNKKFYSIADRVKKEEVLDLPDFQHVMRAVELGDKHRSLYAKVEEQLATDIGEEGEGKITYQIALTRLLRLQQLTSGFAVVDKEDGTTVHTFQDSAKADALEDILQDLPADEPLVVCCNFHHDLDMVHEIAAKHGRKSKELSGRRDDVQGKWEDGEDTVLAVQIRSGGLGVDLTRSRYCVLWSVGYSLGDYEQFLARQHRQGQTRKVTYYHLVARNTVDEKVYKALRDKSDVVKAILEYIKPEVMTPTNR